MIPGRPRPLLPHPPTRFGDDPRNDFCEDGMLQRFTPPPPVIVLMGPTASGKTPLAMSLAGALPIEIVSVDSAQVYRDMDVGTAKPSPSDRRTVTHHLIDVIDPTETYSAARFRDDAMRVLEDIAARGRIPLLAGGTMLYFKALREGLSELPEANAEVRAAIDVEAAQRGWPRLHAELAEVDPVTAARLKPNDAQRIQRALEVFRLTGKPMSAMLARRKRAELPLRLIQIALAPSDRSFLHRRIEERFDAMLGAGLVEELRSLRERYALRSDLPSMRCVGYRQAWEFIEGKISRKELRERGVFATRQLAKRQLTWLRAMPDIAVFDCLAPGIAASVRTMIETELG